MQLQVLHEDLDEDDVMEVMNVSDDEGENDADLGGANANEKSAEEDGENEEVDSEGEGSDHGPSGEVE